MALQGFTFRGRHSSEFFLVNRVNKSVTPPVTEKLLEVPNRKGAYDFGTEIGARRFDIEVTIIESSTNDLAAKIREITEWLLPPRKVNDKPMPLTFDTEPDLEYRARFVGEASLETMASVGTATLSFVAPDPHAYGPTITTNLEGSPAVVMNGGGVETYPTVKLNFLQPTTSFMIAHKDLYSEKIKHLLIGKPANVEQSVVNKEERVFWDQMTTVSEWTAGGDVSPSLTVAGSFKSDGYRFMPRSYYADESYEPDYEKPWNGPYTGWHGPHLKKALSEPVQDFVFRSLFEFRASHKERVGRLDVFFLDANGARLGKVGLVDRSQNTENTVVEAVAGGAQDGHAMINTNGSRIGAFNDFYGKIDVRREGNRWNAYAALIDRQTGKAILEYTSRKHEGYFIDKANKWTNPIAQIQISASAYRDYKPVDAVQIHDLKVYKVNNINEETEVPFMVEAGDTVEIDCAKAAIYHNGLPAMHLLDPSSEFFALEKGGNEISFEGGTAGIDIEYKERWL
jgi:predicted phage tail component-like protein